MARLILGETFLDIYYYEHTQDGLLIDRDRARYDEAQMYHNYSDTFPLKRCMLGGVEVKCPKYPIKFLDINYGQNVVMPDMKCKNGKWIKV